MLFSRVVYGVRFFLVVPGENYPISLGLKQFKCSVASADAIIHGRVVAATGMVIREIILCHVKQTVEIN